MNDSNVMGTLVIEHRRRLLHHLKALFWCLHQMQTRYDLNLVLYSLEHRQLHTEIRDSNLGDNLAFLMEHLEPEDLGHVADAIRLLPDSIGSMDIMDNHFEIGHYIQANRGFNQVCDGEYGIIAQISPQLRGLFYCGDGHVALLPFDPSGVRCIFGTYIV